MKNNVNTESANCVSKFNLALVRSNTVSERKLKRANEYKQDFFHLCTDEKLKSRIQDIVQNKVRL